MSFDLNIGNYTRNELIDMFELPPTFDNSFVESRETKLIDNIINNGKINNDVKQKTIDFLKKAKNIIVNENIFTEKQPQNTPFQQKIADVYNSSYDLKEIALDNSGEHMVQRRQDKPYLSSFPSEFFPGIINPLKKRTIRKNLNIDTRFRENYYSTSSTNFNLSLPINIENILQMQLSSIELPSSYFVISKQYNNNYFNLIVNEASAIITIPDGNYDKHTIMDTINEKISYLGYPFNDVTFAVNLSATSTTGSSRTMVGINENSTITTIELNFQNDRAENNDHTTPLPLKLGWNLGFRNGRYVGSLNYVSEGIIDLTGPKYVYLVIDDYNNNVNNNFYSAFNSSILNKNILARISQNNNITFTHVNEDQKTANIVATPREYFGPINLYNMNIQLLDEYGRILDLNNMDYSFCLTLVTIYDL